MPQITCYALPYVHYHHSFERALEGIRRAGYRHVGFTAGQAGISVNRGPLPDERVRRIKALCAEHGLQPSVLHGIQIMNQDLPTLCRHIDLAAMLGIRVIIALGPFSYRRFGYYQFPTDPKSEVEQRADHEEFLVRVLPVAEYAARRKVMLTLKPHTGNAGTGPALVKTLRDIGSEWVKATYDPGNVALYERVNPAEDIVPILSQTVSLVAKDQRGGQGSVDFPVPGEGDIDFVKILTLLKDVGFDGPIGVERLNGTGQDPITLEEIDRRVEQARRNIVAMLKQSGYSDMK